MSRLAAGGRRIDRTRPFAFSFDGRRIEGFAGDTLASALMAAGVRVLGRSFKYHRPRGLVGSGPEEPNALLTLGEGRAAEPNARATLAPLADALHALSQNRWPSLGFDIGAAAGLAAPLLPAGFYYKTFIAPGGLWERLYEPLIRRAAGLGRIPEPPDPDRYEHLHVHPDVLVAGGGVAGLAAALAAGRAGASVLLCEQGGHWGGRAPVDGALIDGAPASAFVDAALAELARLPNVRLRLDTAVLGLYDHGYLLAAERLGGPLRERLWRIRARRTIVAAGAIERPLPFPGNDRPGVLLAAAIRDFAANHAAVPGARIAILTAGDDGYRTALALSAAGVAVPVIVDVRPAAIGALPQAARARGLRVEAGRTVVATHGRHGLRAIAIGDALGQGSPLETIPCDALGMAGGWTPSVHLWSQAGGGLAWDDALGAPRPDPARPPRGADGAASALAAGAANGSLATGAALAEGHAAGAEAARAAGHAGDPGRPADAEDPAEAPPAHPALLPAHPRAALRKRIFLDFQNDVTAADVELAAREGYVSVEHAKRYTTLGMATDQGKLSNIPGIRVLAAARDLPPGEVGTTTFRPPYVPLTFGTIAGAVAGPLFQPVRVTPLEPRHAGAPREPAQLWRRPLAYPEPGESLEAAVHREVRAVREAAGILDASTLGKILVAGPDAGTFLDRLYTGRISTLREGRCRYALLCTENGFLFDDGVVARLGPDTFLCHTTTGGADRVHAHFEEWRQTEWPALRVFTQALTEAHAQIVLAGPAARDILARLGGIDVSREALPHMAFVEGSLGGHAVRVLRVSFSGETSFEIQTGPDAAPALWDALRAAGDVTPYGTEAMHVLRAEKGYVMIGEETDGTVTPQDLGLGWAVADKADFVGKRGMARSFLTRDDRWRLVGLLALDGSRLPHGALAVRPGTNASGQRLTEGRVTSTYHSPTLGHPVALGLVERGPERLGEVLRFADGEREIEARIVAPVFYDPDGARLA